MQIFAFEVLKIPFVFSVAQRKNTHKSKAPSERELSPKATEGECETFSFSAVFGFETLKISLAFLCGTEEKIRTNHRLPCVKGAPAKRVRDCCSSTEKPRLSADFQPRRLLPSRSARDTFLPERQPLTYCGTTDFLPAESTQKIHSRSDTKPAFSRPPTPLSQPFG